MKNKKIVIIVAVILIILVAGGGTFFILKKSVSGSTPTPTPEQQEAVLTLQPADIGLSLVGITSGKFADNGVEIQISKLTDIASIDYEMDYTSTGDIPRGAIGHVDVKPTDTTFTQQLPFGTCSDKCHFDTGISNVKITLKVTKQDGKIYQVVQSYNP